MDFATYMKIMFPIAVVVAVVVVVVRNVNEYKEIRRENPGLTAGQAFGQYIDNVNAQAAEDRKERREQRRELREKRWAEQLERDKQLAEDLDYEMIKNGMENMYEENGKVYYRGDDNARYSYDTSTHELKREK